MKCRSVEEKNLSVLVSFIHCAVDTEVNNKAVNSLWPVSSWSVLRIIYRYYKYYILYTGITSITYYIQVVLIRFV